ncbi:hypothetical protein CEXT_246221 [Caerostris extrusa]|uniref:Uncharacterized protein n=1 Tax=Caerostris extrusa TaxID=172846 RepID=A0AAV4R867_CAEEX|nr:hypothetical protein CEXT_246221 [Caerostris extrusa]
MRHYSRVGVHKPLFVLGKEQEIAKREEKGKGKKKEKKKEKKGKKKKSKNKCSKPSSSSSLGLVDPPPSSPRTHLPPLFPNSALIFISP